MNGGWGYSWCCRARPSHPFQYIISFQHVHSLPFLKEKVSDENTYAPSVIETMALLGKLAKGSSDALKWEVARAVAAFYSKQPDKAHLEGELRIATLCHS